LKVDTSGLSAGDKQALVKLIQAARIVNHIFMQQFWSGDLALYTKLQEDKRRWGRRASITSGSTKGRGRRLTSIRRFCPASRRRSRGREFLSGRHDQRRI